MKTTSHARILAAALAIPLCAHAQTVTFEEFTGYADNDPIPAEMPPFGVPDPITATWTGFLLHTREGDTPMSIFTAADVASADDAIIRFSGPVVIPSINTFPSTWGSAMSITGKRWGKVVWQHSAAGADAWSKVTAGAAKEIDTLVFEGQWNHFDDIAIEPAPDTDGDGYTDGDETTTGHDPNDPNNNPEAQAIANSITEWTTTGIQGENGWYYGYRNVTADGGGESYDPNTKFIPFTPEQWNGGGFAVGGNPPWTQMGMRDLHPNGSNNGAEHWVIRRWVADEITQETALAIRWHAHHQNVACGGNGVTGLLFKNGQLLDKAVIAAPDGVGVTHTFYINAQPGDKIDVALSPVGTDGSGGDGCDGSQTWFLVDPTIPADPRQPDGSIFVAVGSGDTDADGLPDVWEKSYFPNDLTKLSRTGDFDQDGVTDLVEFEKLSNPTKADTDDDGLTDQQEIAAGTDLTKADTDGDGLSDAAEVNRVPPTDPTKADTDGDGYSDTAEIAAGSNPVSASDTPVTYVLANSETEFSGFQGTNGWYWGYRVYDPVAAVVNYNPSQDFIPFPGGQDQGDWDGVNQTWVNGQWDLNTAGDAPWTELGRLNVHPNGANSAPEIGGTADPTKEHWPIRRWVASEVSSNTPVTIVWVVKKTNLNNNGVTGFLFVNGEMVQTNGVAGNDGIGTTMRHQVVLKPNDVVDLALSPAAPDGAREDWSDGSISSFVVDARPAPVVSDISMSVSRSGDNLTIQWTPAGGTLQSTTSLGGTPTWTDAGTANPTTVTIGTANTFYRVRQ